jgi:hypothetical protein
MNTANCYEVPCCANCNNGYFDETACFIPMDCPNENYAGHGFLCDKYNGNASFTPLKEYLMRDVIKELDQRILYKNRCGDQRMIPAYEEAIAIIRGEK